MYAQFKAHFVLYYGDYYWIYSHGEPSFLFSHKKLGHCDLYFETNGAALWPILGHFDKFWWYHAQFKANFTLLWWILGHFDNFYGIFAFYGEYILRWKVGHYDLYFWQIGVAGAIFVANRSSSIAL